MLTESTGANKPVAVIIVGADALLAARPATPIQLWHACVASGYDLAVPATWGDELIAAESLRALGVLGEPVAIMCSCPMVARAIGEVPTDLSANLVTTVAPPVAAAKYLRRVYGDRRVHITYAGACPAAADSAIDAWITPAELLGRFRETAIALEEQPELFESILPPDRRRHLSQPGGLPAGEQLATMTRPRRVDEVSEANLVASIERHLSTTVRTVLDLAPRAGCACSGAIADADPAEARSAITVLEPPRSTRPVMADPGGLGLSRRLPVRQPAPTNEPARPRGPLAVPPATRPERERPAAIATRASTLSPLSWHLRERALPQPPTTARSEQRRSPESVRSPEPVRAAEQVRGTGASSSAWAKTAASAEREAASAQSADPVTAAAVRALEQAAAVRSAGIAKPADEVAPPREAVGIADVVREAERSSAEEPSIGHEPSRAEEPSGAEERPPAVLATALDAAPQPVVSPEPSRQAEAAPSSSEPRPSRATPPGGYWFAAPIIAGGMDAEVRRPSTPVDAVPDDLAAREAAVSGEVEEHPHEEARPDSELPQPHPTASEESAAPDEPASPPVAEPVSSPSLEPERSASPEPDRSAAPEPERPTSLGSNSPGAPGTHAASPDSQYSTQSDRDAEIESEATAAAEPVTDAATAAKVAPEQGAPKAESPGVEGSAAASGPEAEGPPADRPASLDVTPDDVRAELAELFGLNEGSPDASSRPPSAGKSEAPPPTEATIDEATRPPTPRHASTPGPLPWKWLVGAALLIVAAVALSRKINSRVTTEESGTSALTGASGTPGGLLAPGVVPTGGVGETTAAPRDNARVGSEVRPAATSRPRIQRGLRAVAPVPGAADSAAAASSVRAPDSVTVARPTADGVRRDTTPSPPVVAPLDSVARPTARELEIQAIRDELARRTARLDSMSRAMGSLYVAPRRPPPGGMTRPPVAPPTLRDPRQ